MQIIGTAELYENWQRVLDSAPKIIHPAAVISIEFFDG